MKKRDAFTIEDHLCRKCCGRILRYVNSGVTAGGNPLFRCADCGNSGSGMDTAHLCWCGFSFKGQEHMKGAYVCVPFSVLTEKPWLADAFRACGSDPERHTSEIGVLTADAWRQAERSRQ